MQRTGLFTDQYEFTMLSAALADGSADRRCTFEVFSRRLPELRRFGVVAGTSRFLAALAEFSVSPAELELLLSQRVIDERCADFLANYRFTGDISGYIEGEPYFPNSPILSVTSSFAEAVVLETLALSILNHDSAVAAAAARMVIAAGGRPLIEMGSRRTHEQAAVAAARAAYLVGFTATSNLAAGAQFDIPTTGTAAHAFTLLHDSEQAAFAAQLAQLGVGTTLLVDTYDTRRGIETAIATAGPGARRGTHRFRRSDRDGPPGPRAAGLPSAPPGPRSWSAVTWTSTRSPRWPPPRWIPTASAPRWWSVPACRRPGWSTS